MIAQNNGRSKSDPTVLLNGCVLCYKIAVVPRAIQLFAYQHSTFEYQWWPTGIWLPTSGYLCLRTNIGIPTLGTNIWVPMIDYQHLVANVWVSMFACQLWSTNTWNQHLSTNDWLPTFGCQHLSIYVCLLTLKYQHLEPTSEYQWLITNIWLPTSEYLCLLANIGIPTLGTNIWVPMIDYQHLIINIWISMFAYQHWSTRTWNQNQRPRGWVQLGLCRKLNQGLTETNIQLDGSSDPTDKETWRKGCEQEPKTKHFIYTHIWFFIGSRSWSNWSS